MHKCALSGEYYLRITQFFKKPINLKIIYSSINHAPMAQWYGVNKQRSLAHAWKS